MKMRVLTAGLVLMLAGSAWAQEQPATPATKPATKEVQPKEEKKLKLGDKAPPLTIEKWVKGEPVTGFEKGKVYVVEFWATWCRPCIAMFPHLSELQKEFKDRGVTIIGTNIWEDKGGEPYSEETFGKIQKFVEKQGERMSYTVAYDGAAAATDKAYMQAAGQNGIPCAFVVNQDGVVAFIGHPMEMDRPLKEILAGKYDLKAAELASDVKTRATAALRKGNFDEGIKIIDEGISQNAKIASNLAELKFQGLLFGLKDSEKAHAWASEAADKYLTTKYDAQALNSMAWVILDNPQVTKPDPKVALKLAKKAVEASDNKDGMIMDTLALAYSKTGDAAKAYETQKKAVELVKADSKADPRMVEEMSQRLAEFEKAANEKK